MPYLALILFSPWFLILGALFWIYPRQPRPSARKLFDALTLLLAGGGSFIGMNWAYRTANTDVGAMWKQIFACLIAYSVFLGVMTLAVFLRIPLLRKPA
ncbi:MAG: hypothetical protein JSR34_00560 [Proteobacteria bacterium]|nr:hypothetical protein [Pseudomonadota bacterium]